MSSEQNGRGSIQLPGQMDVNFQMQDGPGVHPAVVTVQLPGCVRSFVVGGITKREHIVTELVAAYLSDSVLPDPQHHGHIVDSCLALAEVVLEKCRPPQTKLSD